MRVGGFNPLPVLRPGATGTLAVIGVDYRTFQSSPGLATGSNGTARARTSCDNRCFNPLPVLRPGATIFATQRSIWAGFQSSPGLATGSNVYWHRQQKSIYKVSILSRSCDREQRRNACRVAPQSVSILSRSCDREQLWQRGGFCCHGCSFNPLPVLRPGATV